jgi:hypothetical protein
MELTNKEKINLLNVWIDNLTFHINALQQGIKDSPNSDIEGKTPRLDVLNDLINTKTFYKNVLQELLELP